MTLDTSHFALVLVRDLEPWREFIAAALTEIHARGCCEDVLAAYRELERLHRCYPPACEVRVVLGNRELPEDRIFETALAMLVTTTGRDCQGRRVLTLRYGWARPGCGVAALRWGAGQLDTVRRAQGCTVMESWCSRDEKAYAKFIGDTLGLQPVPVTVYRRVYTED